MEKGESNPNNIVKKCTYASLAGAFAALQFTLKLSKKQEI